MKIQFFSAGLFLFIHASFYHLFMLTKLLWIMNESFCSSLLTRKTIHLLSITMLLFVTNFMLHNGVPVAHWQPPFRKKRALLWNFSSFFKLNCTSRFFNVQAVDFINMLLKEQVYLCTVDFLPAFYNVVHKEYYDYRSTLSNAVN